MVRPIQTSSGVFPRSLSLPTFSDEDQTRTARSVAVIGTLGILVSLASAALVLIESRLDWLTAAILGLVCGFCGLATWLAYRGAALVAGWIVILGGIASTAMLVFTGTSRGFEDIAMMLFPVLVIVGSVLLDRRGFVIGLVLVLASVCGILAAGLLGAFEPRPPNSHLASDFGIAFLIVVVSAASARLLANDLVRSVARTRRDQQSLAEANSRLEDEARQRSQLIDDLEARTGSLNLVVGLADRLHRTLNMQSIAAEAVDALVEMSNPPFVAFYILDTPEEHLDLIAQQGFDEETIQRGSRIPISGSLTGTAIQDRKLIVSDDVGTDTRVFPAIREALQKRGISTAVVIPMLFEGRALGSLNLSYREKRGFEPEDLATFQGIGNTVALALVNARRLAEMQHQAFHDSLTGLANRLELHRTFTEVIAATPVGAKIGLVLLDLDRFKEINDALGHHAGDEILKLFGQRLTRALGDRKPSAYRLGGDEFSLILPGLSSPVEAESLIGEAMERLRRPFEVGGMKLEVTASAGIAVYPDHGADSHELLRVADVAMYQAKSSPSGIAAYSDAFELFTLERLELASELRDAIRQNQLVLHYQPIVALDGGFTLGFEALVRWQHPHKGLLGPDAFVPLAEVGDLIHPLTDWVIETALTQLSVWSRDRPELSMSVNISARSLLDATFTDTISRIIDRSGVDPTRIEVELTETALISDPVTSARTLERVTGLGVRVAIDDFGTGYSSLLLLRSLPIQALKIDRSFVADLRSGDHQSRAIVEATVQLATNLRLQVIAEGVEDSETAATLREMGCDRAQGYHFGRPAPAAEILWG